MPEYKNQHYLPEFYLKGFTNPKSNMLQVFKPENKYWQKQGVGNVACSEYLHSFKEDDGSLNHGIEDIFSKLESHFSIVLRKVLAGEPLDKKEQITFGCFVMSMWQRVPSQIDYINHLFSGLTWHDTLLSMLKFATRAGEIVYEMDWTFLMAIPPDCFITSDYPFYLYDPSPLSPCENDTGRSALTQEEVQICLPLSRHMAFVGQWENKGGIRHWTLVATKTVEMVNLRTAARSSREIIASRRTFPGSEIIVKGSLGTFPPEAYDPGRKEVITLEMEESE